MIAKYSLTKNSVLIFLLLVCSSAFAQQALGSLKYPKVEFYDLRGTNVVDVGVGTSVINGDYQDPLFEIYFHVGYKHYIFPHLNINIGYNKFNLGYKDVLNEGFMSFDLNVESTLMPHNKFSPFVFAGAGYNAANYFEQTATKLQGGGGIEYIASDKLGLKLYTDYNYVMSDELDGLIAGASDDTYFRIGFGINFYFGGEKKKAKILENYPSIIKSNQIISDN